MTADLALQVIVQVVNENPGSVVDMTLAVNGLLVSGTVVASVEWFRIMEERMRAASDGLAYLISEMGERLDPAEELPQFVHMLDVGYFVAGEAVPADCDALWRGRLDGVDGWSIGRLGAVPVHTAAQVLSRQAGPP